MEASFATPSEIGLGAKEAMQRLLRKRLRMELSDGRVVVGEFQVYFFFCSTDS
jgi:hypothetical protein